MTNAKHNNENMVVMKSYLGEATNDFILFLIDEMLLPVSLLLSSVYPSLLDNLIPNPVCLMLS